MIGKMLPHGWRQLTRICFCKPKSWEMLKITRLKYAFNPSVVYRGGSMVKLLLNTFWIYSPWQHMVKNDFAPACHKCYNEHELGKSQTMQISQTRVRRITLLEEDVLFPKYSELFASVCVLLSKMLSVLTWEVQQYKVIHIWIYLQNLLYLSAQRWSYFLKANEASDSFMLSIVVLCLKSTSTREERKMSKYFLFHSFNFFLQNGHSSAIWNFLKEIYSLFA